MAFCSFLFVSASWHQFVFLRAINLLFEAVFVNLDAVVGQRNVATQKHWVADKLLFYTTKIEWYLCCFALLFVILFHKNSMFKSKNYTKKLNVFVEFFLILKLCVFTCSGERQHVTNIGYTCQEHNQTFKTNAIATVLCTTVFSQIVVPPIVFFFKTKLFDVGK